MAAVFETSCIAWGGWLRRTRFRQVGRRVWLCRWSSLWGVRRWQVWTNAPLPEGGRNDTGAAGAVGLISLLWARNRPTNILFSLIDSWCCVYECGKLSFADAVGFVLNVIFYYAILAHSRSKSTIRPASVECGRPWQPNARNDVVGCLSLPYAPRIRHQNMYSCWLNDGWLNDGLPGRMYYETTVLVQYIIKVADSTYLVREYNHARCRFLTGFWLPYYIIAYYR